MPLIPPKEMLRDIDVAALLDISRSTLWSWKTQGLVPEPIKIGRTVRWRAVEIHDWLEVGCPSRAAWEKIRKAEQN